MYVKLFGTILSSSIWTEDPFTRLVFITMLVMADREGIVRASPSGLARFANVPLNECLRAIQILESPDPESRTSAHDGRRIEKIEGGWRVLNYEKYREIRTQEQMATAERVARHRAKTVTRNGGNADVTGVTTNASVSPSVAVKPLSLEEAFETAWIEYPKRAGGNSKALARKAFGTRYREGATCAELVAAVQRYAAFVRATSRENTEYVKQAATFFGPGEHWKEPWAAPTTVSRNGRSLEALRSYAERNGVTEDRPDGV